MSNLAPLVPPDTDLRSFSYMPLKVEQLRDSDLAAIATGEEFRAAVLLWGSAWHQVPASSLPNDDRMLCRLAGLGRDLKSWLRVKDMALRGFELCTDGRLYHPIIADLALEATRRKRKQQDRTSKAREARARRNNTSNNVSNDYEAGSVTDVVTTPVTDSKRIEENRKNPLSPPYRNKHKRKSRRNTFDETCARAEAKLELGQDEGSVEADEADHFAVSVPRQGDA